MFGLKAAKGRKGKAAKADNLHLSSIAKLFCAHYAGLCLHPQRQKRLAGTRYR